MVDINLAQKLISKLVTDCSDVKSLDRFLTDWDSGVPNALPNVVRSVIAQGKSYAQLNQDIIVLLYTGFKKGGYFVEFGATNGVELSNTYLLEKEYNWDGILAEPAKAWHEELAENRNVNIDFSCVWTKSDEVLSFDMVDGSGAVYSTISSFRDNDSNGGIRENRTTYDVDTISLNDLLKKHNAPKKIDYLSIDTEGSEFDILNNFDFGAYDVSIITCEHNGTEYRKKIFELLTRHGFVRKFTEYSKFDDWYFHQSLFD